MDWFIFLVFCLATWRVSFLFVIEDGPFFIFEKIRRVAGIHPEQMGAVTSYGLVAQILSCVWCCSIYVGMFWTEFYFLFPTVSLWFALPLAISAAAILFNILVEKLRS